MAMNKAEKAEMERLRNDLALARAMRWPDYPRPEPMTREEIDAALVEGGEKWGKRQRVARGWFYNAYLGGYGPPKVTYGCSDGFHHSTTGDTTSTQQMGRMYRTEEDAWQCLRLDLTEQCAKLLASVDQAMAASPSLSSTRTEGVK